MKTKVLTTDFNIENNTSLVLFSRISGAFDKSLNGLIAVVTEYTDSIHSMLDHLINEFACSSFVDGSQNASMSLFHTQQAWL